MVPWIQVSRIDILISGRAGPACAGDLPTVDFDPPCGLSCLIRLYPSSGLGEADRHWGQVGLEAFVRMFWGWVEVSGGAADVSRFGAQGDLEAPYVTLGLTDFEGLAYWAYRVATGS